MLLKEIIINGFKSFANRTKIELGPGVTTIVGPNGCGKSNVVDAIRWVLGEQSAKALRGGKMQDVIFAGTDQRQALPICEVTLLFTDCEKELGTAFNEVEIVRRVSRDGSSNYYLNGKTCRLKDIQQLFMDTGVGRVSYSFMVQGQIDQILSTNPAERRVIFEEAAGITRYKSQRREALNKLEQVDQNLSRAQDIVDEVGRQMGTLKRQATKAVRYKKVKHRLNSLDLAFSGYSYAHHRQIIQQLEEKVVGLRESVEGSQSILQTDEEVLVEKKAERTRLYEHLQTAQQAIFDIKSQKDQLENQSKLALVRKSDTEGRIQEIQKELKIIEKQIEELEGKVKDDGHIKQLQLDLVYSSDSKFQEKSLEAEAVQKRLLEAEQVLQNKKREFLKVEGEVNRLRSRSSQLEVALNTHDHQVKDLTTKKTEADNHQQELRANFELLQQGEKAQLIACASAQELFKDVQLRVSKRVELLKEAQKSFQEQDRQLARLNAQVSALEGLQSKFEGFSDGAKAILQGKLGNILQKTEYGLLSKCVVVEEMYTKALESLLGQAIDAITLEELAQVIPITAQLEEKDLGRACLSVAVDRDMKKSKTKALPDFLKPAMQVVNVQDSKFLPRWEQLLYGCYFTDNLEEFIAFWQDNPSFDFQWVVTFNGELVDARGLIYGGARRDKSKSSGFLQRESEIRVLKEKFVEQRKLLDNSMANAKDAQEKVDQAEKEVEEVRRNVALENEKASSLKAECRQAQLSLERNEQTIKRVDEQLEQIKKSHIESLNRLNEGHQELEKFQASMEALRESILRDEEGISRIRQERDEQREILSEMRVDLAERRQRLQMLDEGISENENRRKGLIHRYGQREKDLHRLGDQVEQLRHESEDCKIKALELQKSQDEAMAALEKERNGLVFIEAVIKEFDDKLSSRRKELHIQENGLKNCEVELAKEHAQVNYMLDKVRSEYNLELETVDWKLQLWLAEEEFESRISLEDLDEGEELVVKVKLNRGDPTDEDFSAMDATDWDAVQKELKVLRDRISGMGPVNLVAIEEYVELKERFEFLEKQCNDLKSAKEQLLKAIEEINATSQELFRETFEKVRTNFKFTFDALFGGGIADLELIETEDVLEAGIEITARPPGTKLQSLTLLSGGQKTMTAVALLFAIYKVKPSPFCVLDELDAPLDDANIGRFTLMLREFTRYSQFLVISHNRRTISASDTIYGVTMQEKGVTSLISMRFNKKDKETGAIEAFIEKTSDEAVLAEA